MHELSIALSLVDVASEEAGRLGSRVVAVRLKLGPLSGVVKEALHSAYGLACEGSPLEGSRLVIQDMPITAWCPRCEGLEVIASYQNMCCPRCGTPTPDIRGGRELEVTGLEIVDEPTDGRSPNEPADTHGRSAPAGAQAE